MQICVRIHVMDFKIEDIKYAKILYEKSAGVFAELKVAISKLEGNQAVASVRFSSDIELHSSQEVVLNIISRDGLYKADAILERASAEGPYLYFVLKIVSDFKHQQNREYFRVEVDYNCSYRYLENGTFRDYNTQIVDISANGVCIKIPNSINPQKITELCMIIDKKNIPAKVRYIRLDDRSELKASFAYVKISESDRDFISQICIQKQLELRRRSLR